jgi:predicted dehydrogenase
MSSDVDRRKFIGTAAVTSAFTIVPRHVLGGQAFVAPSDKITLGYIGCGTQGLRELMTMLPMPEIQVVAVCDPVKDSNEYVEFQKGEMLRRIQTFLGKPNWRAGATAAPGGRDVAKEIVETHYADKRATEKFRAVNTYADFRELLDKERDLNAVKVMTPDHLHATILLAAMKKGKHAIVHKPIANRLQEAKLVFDTARETRVATHFMPWGARGNLDLVMKWVRDGAIGTVREIHNWTDRPMWPHYQSIPTDRPPVPKDFDWDLWLGPSLDRPYHPNYTHTVFRGWYEFGGGSIADMGHYSLWPVFTAFNFSAPTVIESTGSRAYEIAELTSKPIRNDFSFPVSSAVRYRMPAHDEWQDIDLYWYDGGMKPPAPRELDEDDRQLPPTGLLIVGDKGKILDGRIIPESKMRAYSGPQPPEAPAQGRGRGGGGGMGGRDSLAAWIQAVKGGPPSPGNFLNAIPLTEAINLHTVALRSGKKLRYDAKTMQVTNVPDAAKYLRREYRKGWELG